MKSILTYLMLVTTVVSIHGQDSVLSRLHQIKLLPEVKDTIMELRLDDEMVNAMVIDGDTMIIAALDDVSISAPRTFSSRQDYLRYRKYKRYAARVYPYAKEAIRIFSEAQIVTRDMKRRKRKRYLKKLSKELKREFEDPLRGLSKTQGKIMVKMIEKELETPMYDLIKMTRGRFKAFYWNQSSKLYGYRLKDGYEKGKNPILDIVLQDFDLSYDPQ